MAASTAALEPDEKSVGTKIFLMDAMARAVARRGPPLADRERGARRGAGRAGQPLEPAQDLRRTRAARSSRVAPLRSAGTRPGVVPTAVPAWRVLRQLATPGGGIVSANDRRAVSTESGLLGSG